LGPLICAEVHKDLGPWYSDLITIALADSHLKRVHSIPRDEHKPCEHSDTNLVGRVLPFHPVIERKLIRDLPGHDLAV